MPLCVGSESRNALINAFPRVALPDESTTDVGNAALGVRDGIDGRTSATAAHHESAPPSISTMFLRVRGDIVTSARADQPEPVADRGSRRRAVAIT